ncbi:MAG: lysophospholipid acyltransferase family protein [Clostridia bacterium]|nr:lysophospholipid acyltransferase family protein [Clostridia bacterium]
MLVLKILGIAVGVAASAALLLVLLFFVCSLLVDTKKTYEEESPFYRWMIDVVCFFAVHCTRTRLHVSGKSAFPKGRYLLVQNHLSNVDPFFTMCAFKNEKLIFVSKPSNFRIPIVGPTIHRCLFMAIDRENPRNAIMTINRASEIIANNKGNVAIYPEGTRNMTGETLLPFHNGVFKIAQRANVPIVVTSIKGAEKIRENFPWRATDVSVDVLGVIPAEELKGKGTAEIGERVEKMLRKHLEP